VLKGSRARAKGSEERRKRPAAASRLHLYSKSLPTDKATGRLLNLRSWKNYGLGLDVVVVVVSFFSVEAGGLTIVFVVSFFSVLAGGLTTVVLCSTFLSAPGEAAGVTTVSFCSQAPTSAAPAKMQISFFIGVGLIAPGGAKPESARRNSSALPTVNFRRGFAGSVWP
jgi:hypothetical protein